ncbi:MAG: methyltransferase [Bacteroidia bacterium]|nr:methyltransferase [Bacteroidia bacterium]
MRNRIWKISFSFFVKPFIRRRLKEETEFSYGGLDIVVKPGVFHPEYFFSTGFFLDHIYDINFKEKTFCEVGCGTGIISLLAFRNGAKVISLDISKKAIDNTKENYRNNFNENTNPDFSIIRSDLFDNLQPVEFDFIFINPPYFFREPKDDEQKAWFCGKEGQYFKKLFYQLPEFSSKHSDVLMVLSDNCDVKRIKDIARNFGYKLLLIYKRRIKWEWNFLFRLEKI